MLGRRPTIRKIPFAPSVALEEKRAARQTCPTCEIGVQKVLRSRRGHILLQFLAKALSITYMGGVSWSDPGLRCPPLGGKTYLVQCLRQEWTDWRRPSLDSSRNIDRGHADLGVVRLISGMVPAFRASDTISSKILASSHVSS